MQPEDLTVILVTDCGSTTTKAILIEKTPEGEYRQTFRGEAPTTVEKPHEDVTRGVLNAIQELEELSGRKILNGEEIIKPVSQNRGVDLYISTSSAGGGLQMIVTGVIKSMSTESAERCALGAGAIVVAAISSDDGLPSHEKIDRFRKIRPDIVLMAGGTDGGTKKHVIDMAEILQLADPRPRFGDIKLPVMYAGNADAASEVKEILGAQTALSVVENILPVLGEENLVPARTGIHDIFLVNVMSQAPGYANLIAMTGALKPTPAAVGVMMQATARERKQNIFGTDIGGATTDNFSVFDGQFHRSVSANLGMSYSIGNVLKEAGVANILRWVPFRVDEADFRNRIKNKMIRPTTVPQTLEDLYLEHAIAREALRLAFEHHKSLAVELRGVHREHDISWAFSQEKSGKSIIDVWKLDLIIGSGGILSHSPRRVQSLLMMLDAFGASGITEFMVDSIFMMPHLGVLAEINERAALEVLFHDCLVPLGVCIAPVGEKQETMGNYSVVCPAGTREGVLKRGELIRLPLGDKEEAEITFTPVRGVNAGAGPGKMITRKVTGGAVGIVFDGRGRPISLPENEDERIRTLQQWFTSLDAYPDKEGGHGA